MDLLTIDQARAGLGWSPGQNAQHNPEIEAVYIPAVTELISAWCGRMEDRTEVWWTSDPSPITTPWATGTVASVRAGDAELAEWDFSAGVLTITDPQYTPGDEVRVGATGLPVPYAVVKAAQITLAHLWNSDHQGQNTAANSRAKEPTPTGTGLPRRAEALLAPYWHIGGFR